MKQMGALAEIVGALLLAAIVLIVLAEVVARYLLQMSISWPEELARYVSVWLTFVGAAAAGARHEQIVVDLIAPIVPRPMRHLMRLVACVLSMAAVGILVWAMSPLLFGPAGLTASPGTGIELRWVYLGLPVGGALLVLFLLSDLGKLLRGQTIEKKGFGGGPAPASGGSDG